MMQSVKNQRRLFKPSLKIGEKPHPFFAMSLFYGRYCTVHWTVLKVSMFTTSSCPPTGLSQYINY
jgi:hypothetical protein